MGILAKRDEKQSPELIGKLAAMWLLYSSALANPVFTASAVILWLIKHHPKAAEIDESEDADWFREAVTLRANRIILQILKDNRGTYETDVLQCIENTKNGKGPRYRNWTTVPLGATWVQCYCHGTNYGYH
jgi:hypothetical protein